MVEVNSCTSTNYFHLTSGKEDVYNENDIWVGTYDHDAQICKKNPTVQSGDLPLVTTYVQRPPVKPQEQKPSFFSKTLQTVWSIASFVPKATWGTIKEMPGVIKDDIAYWTDKTPDQVTVGDGAIVLAGAATWPLWIATGCGDELPDTCNSGVELKDNQWPKNGLQPTSYIINNQEFSFNSATFSWDSAEVKTYGVSFVFEGYGKKENPFYAIYDCSSSLGYAVCDYSKAGNTTQTYVKPNQTTGHFKFVTPKLFQDLKKFDCQAYYWHPGSGDLLPGPEKNYTGQNALKHPYTFELKLPYQGSTSTTEKTDCDYAEGKPNGRLLDPTFSKDSAAFCPTCAIKGSSIGFAIEAKDCDGISNGADLTVTIDHGDGKKATTKETSSADWFKFSKSVVAGTDKLASQICYTITDNARLDTGEIKLSGTFPSSWSSSKIAAVLKALYDVGYINSIPTSTISAKLDYTVFKFFPNKDPQKEAATFSNNPELDSYLTNYLPKSEVSSTAKLTALKKEIFTSLQASRKKAVHEKCVEKNITIVDSSTSTNKPTLMYAAPGSPAYDYDPYCTKTADCNKVTWTINYKNEKGLAKDGSVQIYFPPSSIGTKTIKDGGPNDADGKNDGTITIKQQIKPDERANSGYYLFYLFGTTATAVSKDSQSNRLYLPSFHRCAEAALGGGRPINGGTEKASPASYKSTQLPLAVSHNFYGQDCYGGTDNLLPAKCDVPTIGTVTVQPEQNPVTKKYTGKYTLSYTMNKVFGGQINCYLYSTYGPDTYKGKSPIVHYPSQETN